MTFVSTVSSGTYGTYEPYDFTIPSYDIDSRTIDSFERSRVGFGKSYEGTGGYAKKCPRGVAGRVRAKIKRRAGWRALCGRGHARRRRGVSR